MPKTSSVDNKEKKSQPPPGEESKRPTLLKLDLLDDGDAIGFCDAETGVCTVPLPPAEATEDPPARKEQPTSERNHHRSQPTTP